MSENNDLQLRRIADSVARNARVPFRDAILAALQTEGLDGSDLPAAPAPVDVSSLKSKGLRKIIMENGHSPGDVVMMTAAIRDLHATYPGEYQTGVSTSANEIFEANPFVVQLDENAKDVIKMRMHYPLINQSNEGSYHFIHAYRKYLEECIGRPITQGHIKGDIHLSDAEKGWVSVVEEICKDDRQFWIIDAGHKNDFTAKAWDFTRYQEVVDHFKDKIQFVQMGHKDHTHPDLKGVINLVGQTDMRQLIRLFYHASGVITPVSLPMVLAAAIPMKYDFPKNRACVVLSGGREPVQWQMYPNHQFLHTCGTMACCDAGGCWKSRVVPIGDGDEKDKSNLCEDPVKLQNGQDIGRCMYNITTTDVIRAIERYYSHGGTFAGTGVFKYLTKPTIEHHYDAMKRDAPVVTPVPAAPVPAESGPAAPGPVEEVQGDIVSVETVDSKQGCGDDCQCKKDATSTKAEPAKEPVVEPAKDPAKVSRNKEKKKRKSAKKVTKKVVK